MWDEANRIAPMRNRKADGSIGDTSHQARTSDHNPSNGWVCALDLTHAPESGFDAHARARMVVARHDHRIKYVISNRMIAKSYASRGYAPWEWQPYTGSNPHTFHAHFSVHNTTAARSDKSLWWLPTQQEELTVGQYEDIMAKLEVMHSEQTKQHARVVELLDAIHPKIRTSIYTARDGLAKLIRELHG